MAKSLLGPFQLLLVFLVGRNAYSQGMISGATTQENDELRVLSTQDTNATTSKTLKILDDFVKMYPENRPIRLRRADLLMSLGKISDAAKDIQLLAEKSPDFPGVRQAGILLAHVSGNNKEELALYENWSQMKPEKDQTKALATQLDAEVYAAHIAELKGNSDAADAAWRGYLASDHSRGITYYRAYGDFLSRTGRYDSAVSAYQFMLDHRAPGAIGDFELTAKCRAAAALWAQGKNLEAQSGFLQVVKWAQQLQPKTQSTTESIVVATISANVLIRDGFVAPDPRQAVEDRATVDASMKQLVSSLDIREIYRYDTILAVASGKLTVREAAQTQTKVLAEAPYLDWALWSDLFLACNYPDEAGRVLKELKDDTIQHHILANRKANPNQTMPSTRQ